MILFSSIQTGGFSFYFASVVPQPVLKNRLDV